MHLQSAAYALEARARTTDTDGNACMNSFLLRQNITAAGGRVQAETRNVQTEHDRFLSYRKYLLLTKMPEYVQIYAASAVR